jgi:ferritin-like protein
MASVARINAWDAAAIPLGRFWNPSRRGALLVLQPDGFGRRRNKEKAMSSEGFHVPVEKLSARTKALHYAISSLIEEFEAVDWYYQRADDADDPELKAILLHNAHEELEHASMVLEWLRRADPKIDENLREYLFKDGSIVGREHAMEAMSTDQG